MAARIKKPAKPKVKLPLQQVNLYKVSASQWKKWPDIAQRVFNETYGVMLENQRLFFHPKAPALEVNFWKTTAWNAAWTAADAVVTALDGIVNQEGYATA